MSFTSSLPKSTKTSVQVISYTSSDSQPNEKQRVDLSEEISDNISQLRIIGDISPILSQFECCVCLEYINPPILQCQNSHVFCQTCRKKFESPAKCPTCRVELLQTDIRSHSLEQIADTLGLQFPCKYSSNGCDVTSLLTEKAKHEELCEFVPYRCPHVFIECQWLGSREHVIQHLIDEHQYPAIKSHLDFPIELKDDREYICLSLLRYEDNEFISIIDFDFKYKNNFKAIVLFIGEQRIADQFKYRIEIINKSNGTELQWIDEPISIRSDVKSLLDYDSDDGLNLDKKIINRLSYDKTLDIKLTIQS